MAKQKCEFSGCKCEARWIATRTYGGRGSIRVCDEHKPDPDKRPESLRHLPFFYKVEPIKGDRS